MILIKIKKFQRNMRKFEKVLKNKLKRLMAAKIRIWKRFFKIRIEPNDDLPINEPIKLHLLTILIRCVFSEDGKFYLQLF